VLGLVAGAVAGWALARTLASLQYGVTVTDATTWGIVFGVLALATLIALWRPAREASRVNPAILLRDE
jgi:putative ABC transport system permease protein